MTAFLAFRVASAATAALLMTSTARGQDNADTSAPPPEAAQPAFRSQGFNVTVGNVSADSQGKIVAQLILRNSNPEGYYISVVGSYAASTNAPQKYRLGAVDGVSNCSSRDANWDDDNTRIAACLKPGTGLSKEQYHLLTLATRKSLI